MRKNLLSGARYLSAAVTLFAATTGTGLATAPALAAAAPICQTGNVTPGQPITTVPWAQQRFTPDRFRSIANGSGVTVAVIDSGVDADHPQLIGQVLRGRDFLDSTGDGRDDCVGHGTAVASIIAGRRVDGVAFRGLAPGAKILPVRVSEQQELTDGTASGQTVSPAGFANSIDWAVGHGADVINMSVVLYRDDPAVRAAVARAVQADVVVVAAAGNQFQRGNPRPYPAAYDGVLGVGAIVANGTRLPQSQVGDYVDVVAPGDQVVADTTGGGQVMEQGTSFAAPFVAATAALLRQYLPSLSAASISRRIEATADPAPGGRGSTAYGSGVVNPYRAVTEAVTTGVPERAAPLPAATVDARAVAAQARQAQTRRRALWLALGGAAIAGVALLCAVVIPRGLRRRWRPAG